jgi:hypothetical protein
MVMMTVNRERSPFSIFIEIAIERTLHVRAAVDHLPGEISCVPRAGPFQLETVRAWDPVSNETGFPAPTLDPKFRLPVSFAMPIRPELRPLYPPHWRELSNHVRFARAGGKCQRCGRPHLALLRCLPDGRWFDKQAATWRDRRGRPARWPDLMEATRLRVTRVVLAAAHLDSDPTNNRLKNLRALCQRCHMLHDQPHHLAQRWITYRRRQAVGDLFFGPYPAMIAALNGRPANRSALIGSPENAYRLR